MAEKTAIVTGASRGIGRAIALELAGKGYKVILNYCGSKVRAEQAAEEICAAGGQAKVVQCDVSDYIACETFINNIIKEEGRIDVLVNNAGITRDGLLMKMSEEDFDAVINTNLKGCFHCMRFVSRQMLKQRSGRIINLSSVSGVAGNAGQANYAASKAGVIGLTKTAAKELASRGITVNAIAPGWIDTPMFHKAVDNDPPRLAKILGRIPAKSVGDPMDVGMCAAFLCSDAARYISGTCIPVDGGALIGF